MPLKQRNTTDVPQKRLLAKEAIRKKLITELEYIRNKWHESELYP